jgi:hypothetical protein
MDFKDSHLVLTCRLPFTIGPESNSRRVQDGKCVGLRVNFDFGTGVDFAEQVLCR